MYRTAARRASDDLRRSGVGFVRPTLARRTSVDPYLPRPLWAPRMLDLYDPASGQAGTNNGTAYITTEGARSFQPTTDNVTYTTIYDWSTGPGSFSAWIRVDSLTTERRFFLGQTAGGQAALFIGTNAATVRIWHEHDGGADLTRVSGSVLTVDTWHFVTVTYAGNSDATSVQIFVDGEETSYGTTTNGGGTPRATTGTWSLGYSLVSTVSMLGQMASPVFHPTQISLEQHRAIYDAQRREQTDPLVGYSDTFDGSDSLTNRGWIIYNSGAIATQTVSGGEVHLQSTTGGSAGAWWYSQVSGPTLHENGSLVYKLITGDFDARIRIRVRNAANSGSPSSAALEWRFAGIQAQTPAGLSANTNYNYVHLGLGSDPNGQNRIEWKVTDSGGATSPQSTFASDAGSADLDYDLRMVRTSQTMELYYRRTDDGYDLDDDTGWSQVAIGDIIKDQNTPARTGGATPVAFPETLAVGIMPPYAGPQVTLDLQCWVEDFQVRRVA